MFRQVNAFQVANRKSALPIAGVGPDLTLQLDRLQPVVQMIDIDRSEVKVHPLILWALALKFFRPNKSSEFVPLYFIVGNYTTIRKPLHPCLTIVLTVLNTSVDIDVQWTQVAAS